MRGGLPCITDGAANGREATGDPVVGRAWNDRSGTPGSPHACMHTHASTQRRLPEGTVHSRGGE